MATYVIPKHLEGSKNQKNYLWIEFSAYKLPVMPGYIVNTQNPDSKLVGKVLSKWKFLAPMDIMETLNHTWDETETVHTSIASKYVTWTKGLDQFQQMGTELTSKFKQVMTGDDSIDMSTVFQDLARGSKINVPPYKLDLPVVYTNSERISYSLMFPLAIFPSNTQEKTDAKRDIFDPIRELEKLTCPVMEKEFTKIDFPAVFSVKTVGSELINIPRAVLTSVQPTWKGPYMNGYPMSCELTITFSNMLPLYTNNFSGNRVTTNNPNEGN